MDCLPALQSDVPPRRTPACVYLSSEDFPPGLTGAFGVIRPASAFHDESPETDETAFYTVKASRLRENGATALWLCGFGSLLHARRAVLGAGKSDLPVFFSVETDETGELTSEDEDLFAFLLCLQALHVAAVGLSGPFERIEPAIRRFSPYASVPLLAQPEAPAVSDTWRAFVRWLLEAGVRALGAETADTSLEAEAAALFAEYERLEPKRPPRPKDAPILLADRSGVYFLKEEFTLSEPVPCEYDMMPGILAAEDDMPDALLILVHTVDDAEHFVRHIPFIRTAVCFRAGDLAALEHCLRAYPGIALVDAGSDPDERELLRVAGRYGAVVR